jgi:hypothetical protein
MAGTSGTLSRRIPQVYEHSQSFPRLEGTCQRERPENGKAEALLVFSISGGAFSDLRKGHLSKIRKPTKWPTGGGAFSDQGERKLTGGSVSNAFPPSDGLTKRRKCGSAAATSSGFARVQDRAATW